MLKNEIIKNICKFVAGQKFAKTQWGKPLVGFANADDPLFNKLKEVVRASHATPRELLPNARTVIVWFLPFEKNMVRTNKDGYHASKQWAMAYIETNQLILEINKMLAEFLDAQGFESAKLPPTHNFDKEQLMSDWSHKHAAYIAGLGKFGTHHLLITQKGCCGRFGSLITSAPIEPSQRSDKEYCLYKHDKSCGLCVEKCVTGALSHENFDRHKCYELLLENVEIHKKQGYADVCGKCSTMVPCSFKNPVKNIE